MLNKLALLAGLLCLLSGGASAQTRQFLQGNCERGNNTVTTDGRTSTTRVQRSFPSCTVTVYDAGTTTPATISSSSGGAAKANPFTADSDGHWGFWILPGRVDVQLSGSGIPSPFTIANMWVPSTGGSSTTPGSPTTSVQFNSASTFAGSADFTFTNTTAALVSLGRANIQDGALALYTAGNDGRARLLQSPDAGTNLDFYLPPALPVSGNNCLQVDENGAITVTGSACGSGGSSTLTVNTTPIASGGDGLLLYQKTGAVLGQIVGASSDGTNLSFGSGNLRMISPQITGIITDTSGNKGLSIGGAASAVNYIDISGQASGAKPILSVNGTDPNIGITITSKNDGDINIDNSGTSGQIFLKSGNISVNPTSIVGMSVGLASSSDSQLAVQSNDPTSYALRIQSNPSTSNQTGELVIIKHYNALTTSQAPMTVQQVATSGTAGSGFGATNTIQLESATDTGPQTASLRKTYWKTATSATRSAIEELHTTDRATTGPRDITAPFKSITDDTATTIFTVAVPTSGMVGGVVDITVQATDGVDFQVLTGSYYWTAVNKAGTVTGNLQLIGTERSSVSAGTLAFNTSTITTAANAINFNVRANSSLTPTTMGAMFHIHDNTGASITITP